MGDLSNKFGKLPTSISPGTYRDGNLALSGKYGISGRSIVIHDTTGARWVCATIKPAFTELKEVKVIFDDILIGAITFTQDLYDTSADTSILVDLKYADSSMDTTLNHKWHVHQHRVTPSYITQPSVYTTKCGSSITGGHFDPYGLVGTLCDEAASTWDSCEMGDLSGEWK